MLADFLTRDVNIWSSNTAIVRHVLRKLKRKTRRDPRQRKSRHVLLRDCLRAVEAHRELCRTFRI